MIEYPAVIKYSKTDASYLVEFPDLSGCHTYGNTQEEALEMAAEALSGYLESIDLRKMDIPKPSKLTGKNIFFILPEPKIAFAIWLKLKRAEKGLTQKKAAELLNINFQSYQKYENPKKANPTLMTLKKIEKIFGERILI
jgi:antitoxin HicB